MPRDLFTERKAYIRDPYSRQYIVIEGNVIDGLVLTGPFTSSESADVWAELYADRPYDITELGEPDMWATGHKVPSHAWEVDE